MTRTPHARPAKQPAVSVVMTCFNQRAFLAEAIESVLGQSYADLELIVVDDGSSDNSATLVRSYRDPRLSYVWQENAGPSAATNRGIEQARGQHIALMGGDDVCAASRVAVQLDQLRRGYDIVFCLPKLIDSHSEEVPDYRHLSFFQKPFASSDELYSRLFRDGNFLCGSSAFAHRSFFERLGKFRVGLIQLQDFDLWVRACRSAARMALFAERLVRYRVRDDGMNLSSLRHSARIRFELHSIYAEFFGDASATLLQRAFPGEIGEDALDNPIALEVDLAFLYFGHPSDLVRSIGIGMLIRFFDSAAHTAELAGRGFGPRHLFQMMNQVQPFAAHAEAARA